MCEQEYFQSFPLDTERKLNVRKTFNLRPTGSFGQVMHTSEFIFSFDSSEAAVHRCSVKNVFLKLPLNSQESTLLESLSVSFPRA